MKVEGKKSKSKKKDDKEGVDEMKLDADLEMRRTRVICDNDAPKSTSSMQYGGAFLSSGLDQGLRLSKFQESFKVEIKSLKGNDLVFDLIGIDASIANAFRRILISEVPTMAIERVFIANNTSLVQDEVLSHRLGLVPLAVDPREFEPVPADGLATEKNTIVFRLHQKCERQGDKVVGANVLSESLQWLPRGSEWPPGQPKKFTNFGSDQSVALETQKAPAASYPDILLVRMRPKQEVELEAHAVKGIGKTHAKWSPVATASYRMLPEVELLQQVEGEEAEALVKKCPLNVFDIEDLGGSRIARVANPRACTVCRECIREEGWEEKVQLRRVKDHFIFTIESTGSLPPDVLFTEAAKILEEKVKRVAAELG